MKLRSVQGHPAAANEPVKNLDQLTKLENASQQDTTTHLTRIGLYFLGLCLHKDVINPNKDTHTVGDLFSLNHVNEITVLNCL